MTSAVRAQPCYLCMGTDSLEEASFCNTIGEAKAQYQRYAQQLSNWGQELTATLHFVHQQGDDIHEYPDRTLRLGKRGWVIMENT